MILTCVDDFYLAGKECFVVIVTEKVSAVLDVSKIQDDKFKYSGIEIKNVKDGIVISMDEYEEILEDIRIREDISDEELTKVKLKII